MLVIVAVDAKQLPVAAVGRIVVVVVIAMMNGELPDRRCVEFAAASPADPRVDLERPLAISLFALIARASRFGDDAVEPRMIGLLAAHRDQSTSGASGVVPPPTPMRLRTSVDNQHGSQRRRN